MATPVVTVSFTVSVDCDVSPATVNFTDTSTVDVGFKRLWLWDFGDGETSDSQNPSHIYTGDPGQTYDVTLAVLATTGEFDALNVSSDSGPSNRVSNVRTTSGGEATNNAAWAARVLDPSDDHFFYHTINFNGALYFYFTNDATILLKSNSSTLAFVLIQTRVVAGVTDIQGVAEINGKTSIPLLINTWETHSRLEGVTTLNPLTALATVTPQVQLGDPPTGHKWGIDAEVRTRTYANTSTQGYGESTEVEFVSLATEPVAEFTADPAAGPNPLNVQFTNTTEQSDCGPASTWSWKRRLSGSGDAFVEFSTSENPLTAFGKS
jgi:PKD repeat protein